MKDTLTQMLLDNDYASIVNSVVQVAENKIRTKIEERKSEVLKTINSSK